MSPKRSMTVLCAALLLVTSIVAVDCAAGYTVAGTIAIETEAAANRVAGHLKKKMNEDMHTERDKLKKQLDDRFQLGLSSNKNQRPTQQHLHTPITKAAAEDAKLLKNKTAVQRIARHRVDDAAARAATNISGAKIDYFELQDPFKATAKHLKDTKKTMDQASHKTAKDTKDAHDKFNYDMRHPFDATAKHLEDAGNKIDQASHKTAKRIENAQDTMDHLSSENAKRTKEIKEKIHSDLHHSSEKTTKDIKEIEDKINKDMRYSSKKTAEHVNDIEDKLNKDMQHSSKKAHADADKLQKELDKIVHDHKPVTHGWFNYHGNSYKPTHQEPPQQYQHPSSPDTTYGTPDNNTATNRTPTVTITNTTTTTTVTKPWSPVPSGSDSGKTSPTGNTTTVTKPSSSSSPVPVGRVSGKTSPNANATNVTMPRLPVPSGSDSGKTSPNAKANNYGDDDSGKTLLEKTFPQGPPGKTADETTKVVSESTQNRMQQQTQLQQSHMLSEVPSDAKRPVRHPKH